MSNDSQRPTPSCSTPPVAPSDPVGDVLKVVLAGATIFGGAYVVAKLIEAVVTDPEVTAIRESAEKHERRGAAVLADIAGWPRPPVLEGHIPDVLAIYPSGKLVVEEFENDRSVLGHHAGKQHRAFARWQRRSPERRRYTQYEVAGGRGGKR